MSSSSSTTAEALIAREIGFNHRKGMEDVGNFKFGNRELEKITEPSVRKDIRRLNVQNSRRRRD